MGDILPMMGESAPLTTAVMPASSWVRALPSTLVAATMNTAPQGTPLATASLKFIRGFPSTWRTHSRHAPIMAGVGVPSEEMAEATSGRTGAMIPGSSHMATTSTKTSSVYFSWRLIGVVSDFSTELSRLLRRSVPGRQTNLVSTMDAAKVTRHAATPKMV